MQVLENKEELEKQLGYSLTAKEGTKDCSLRFFKTDFELAGSKDDWEEAILWLIDSAVKFKKVLKGCHFL